MTEDEIYAKAKLVWGYTNQALMAVEEASELQKELLHHLRGRGDTRKVVDELADMIIMCRQMRKIFNPDKVDERIRFKLARLENRLEVASGQKEGRKRRRKM